MQTENRKATLWELLCVNYYIFDGSKDLPIFSLTLHIFFEEIKLSYKLTLLVSISSVNVSHVQYFLANDKLQFCKKRLSEISRHSAAQSAKKLCLLEFLKSKRLIRWMDGFRGIVLGVNSIQFRKHACIEEILLRNR